MDTNRMDTMIQNAGLEELSDAQSLEVEGGYMIIIIRYLIVF